jgi:hypothetical protein
MHKTGKNGEIIPRLKSGRWSAAEIAKGARIGSYINWYLHLHLKQELWYQFIKSRRCIVRGGYRRIITSLSVAGYKGPRCVQILKSEDELPTVRQLQYICYKYRAEW